MIRCSPHPVRRAMGSFAVDLHVNLLLYYKHMYNKRGRALLGTLTCTLTCHMSMYM